MIDVLVQYTLTDKPVFPPTSSGATSPFITDGREKVFGWSLGVGYRSMTTSRHPFNIITEEIYD